MLINCTDSYFSQIEHTDSDKDKMILSMMNVIILHFGVRLEWSTVNECDHNIRRFVKNEWTMINIII